MRDQPDLLELPPRHDRRPAPGGSPPIPDVDAADLPSAATGGTEPWRQPTLVSIDLPRNTGAIWLKRGAGVVGIALIAAIGWIALDRNPTPPTQAPTAGTTPVHAVDLPLPQDVPPPVQSSDIAATPAPIPAGASQPPSSDVEPPSPRAEAPAPAPPSTSPDAGAPPPTAAATPRDEDDEDKPEPTDRYEVTVRIEKGDKLESLLRDMDFAPDAIHNAFAALKPVLKNAHLPVGETITLRVQTLPQADAKPILQGLVIRPEARREITLERGSDGGYAAKQRTFDVVLKLVRTGGVVKGSLRGSADAAGVPPPVLSEMLRAFSWDVNFQYDVKGGDRFAVLIEQPYTTDGRPVSTGRVLWAQLSTGAGKAVYNIYRFKPRTGADFFYYGNGQSVVKSFLRTPMDLSRVSSRFGLRNHPILGFTSMHSGVDFAAPYGTPVLATGAGTVVAAGPNGGYGNWVKIDHGSGYATGYGHLARFAPGIRPGVRVRQGQVVGFVGSTGLSTGPHLHYELHQKGKPVNPLNARATQRASLTGKDLEMFRATVGKTDRARDGAELIAARVGRPSGN